MLSKNIMDPDEKVDAKELDDRYPEVHALRMFGQKYKTAFEKLAKEEGAEVGDLGRFEDYINRLLDAGAFNHKEHKPLLEFLSGAIDVVPAVGMAKGLIESAVGFDLFTGDDLEAIDRALGLLGGYGKGTKAVVKIGKDGVMTIIKDGKKVSVKLGKQTLKFWEYMELSRPLKRVLSILCWQG